jgi:hypothetical protein
LEFHENENNSIIKNDFTVIRIFILLFIPNRIYGQ